MDFTTQGNKSAKSNGFNAYAAGNKSYANGRGAPNVGPTSDPTGYKERNLQIKARNNAILRRLKMSKSGVTANPSANAPLPPSNSLVGGIGV